MNLFPFTSEVKTDVERKIDTLPLYKEIAWDFKHNTPIIENGDFKIVEGNEAIIVWIYKAILTERYRYSIYSWDYGSEVTELIGKGYSTALTKEEIKRYIKEALLINPYILDVVVNDVAFEGSLLSVKSVVTTIYEESEVEFNV